MSSTPSPERLFPAKCPCCTAHTAITAEPHCKNGRCAWLKCSCGATINEAGDHAQAKQHTESCPTRVGI